MAKAAPISGLDPQAPLLVNAALIIKTRLDEMLQFEPSLYDPEQVYELHQMRIAAKRLRYTLDIFKPIYEEFSRFGAEFAGAIETVKAIQEHLGEIHDADVLVPQLTEQLARLLQAGYGEDKKGLPLVGVHLVDFDSCQGLLQLCLETRRDRDKRYMAMQRDWQKYQESLVFEKLRGLLAVVQDEAITLQNRTERATLTTANKKRAPIEAEETAHAKDDRIDAEEARSPAPAAPRRRPRTAPASDTGGHPGTGADPGARPAEGRNGQPGRSSRRVTGRPGVDSGHE